MKEVIRGEMRAILRDLPPDARSAAGEDAAHILRQSALYRAAPAVFSYAALPQEFDTAAINRMVPADGKVLALPRIIGPGRMAFFAVTPDMTLIPNRCGINEPPPDAPAADPATLPGALILVPGLAFTLSGKRLGRGGGFYDRCLTGVFSRLHLWGLCYGAQIRGHIPSGPHDVPVTAVLTEGGITFCVSSPACG